MGRGENEREVSLTGDALFATLSHPNTTLTHERRRLQLPVYLADIYSVVIVHQYVKRLVNFQLRLESKYYFSLTNIRFV